MQPATRRRTGLPRRPRRAIPSAELEYEEKPEQHANDPLHSEPAQPHRREPFISGLHSAISSLYFCLRAGYYDPDRTFVSPCDMR